MYKRFIFVFLLLLFIPTTSMASSDSDWKYVLTRNDIVYSIDIESVKVIPIGLNFFIAVDNKKENKVGIISTSVNVKTREFRFEHGSFYDSKTNQKLKTISRASSWKPIYKDSPIEIIVDYIIANHPMFERFKNSSDT